MAAPTSSRGLRGAIIGYGFISEKGHVPAYLERARTLRDVEIVAVADICGPRRETARAALPGARLYETAEALFTAEAASLDFVDISTPPCDHAAIAHLALDAGLHVLCEKPLTTTVAEARSLLEHARRAKRVLFPCHNYKHAPVVKAIREVITSGRIGRVRSVTLSTFRNTHAKGVPEWNTDWRRQRRYSGGGIAMDHGSHSFYLAFEWMGAYPTAVTAKMSNLEPGRWDTEDNVNAVLTFPTGLAHAHLSWTAGVRKVIYSVQGERGAVTVDDDDLEVAVMERTDGPEVAQGAVRWHTERRSVSSHWMDASHVSWFNSLFDQFCGAIDQGTWVGTEAREAFLCVQLIDAAYRSAADGCRETPLSANAPGEDSR
jgi:predicted dehydrogenase